MNLITIGGYTPPAPVSYSVTSSDLDSSESGRSESGYMSRERIRGSVKKINATWRLTTDELLALTTVISGVSFAVTFFYPTTGYYAENVVMYAGDRTLNLVTNVDGESSSYWDFSVNFIEY